MMQSTLTALEMERLDDTIVELARRFPTRSERLQDVQELVIRPTVADWDRLHLTALDGQKKLSLWAAVCSVSDYPATVRIDASDRRLWHGAPTSANLLTALEFAIR